METDHCSGIAAINRLQHENDDTTHGRVSKRSFSCGFNADHDVAVITDSNRQLFIRGIDSTIGLPDAASYDAILNRHLSGVTSCETFWWLRL
jgi:hypothetical protein